VTEAATELRADSASKERTVAVLTAYRPTASLAVTVASAEQQCAKVIVVDNTPDGYVSAQDILDGIPGITILRSAGNIGLAAALNRGVGASGDSEFIFFLDQDSVPEAPMVARLTALLDADPTRGIAAPAPWDAAAERYLDPRTAARPTVARMRVVITSAMLLRRRAWEQTRGMREEFFVDCVDQDLCLQIRQAGWEIVQDKSVLLPHSLGESRWYGVGRLKLRATHHPQWRLYWVARNGVTLSREFFWFDPKWSTTNLAILVYWFITVVVFEPPRLRRARVMLHGMLDAMRRRRDARHLPEPAT
jgi:rhamnosyltransferase